MEYLIGMGSTFVFFSVIVLILARGKKRLSVVEEELLAHWRRANETAMDRNILLGRIADALEESK